jgi:hypothetical protein
MLRLTNLEVTNPTCSKTGLEINSDKVLLARLKKVDY